MQKSLPERKNKLPNILITAGPTVEYIDPVRYISNFSTGHMGFSIAETALSKGCAVNIVSGPVNLSPPPGADVFNVTTALEMNKAVMEKISGVDCIIMSAAVCDFRVEKENTGKIKKTGEKITLELVENPDILRDIGTPDGLIKVGFALESENLIENGKNKLLKKGLDLIVINAVGKGKDPFGEGVNDYTLLDKDDVMDNYESFTKKQIAEIIIDRAIDIYISM